MIEIIHSERCTACNICVTACPVNVFDAVAGGPPVIARQEDCQTCFMCELYCPVDALYVAPNSEALVEPDVIVLEQRDLLGSYRSSIGWGKTPKGDRSGDLTYALISPH